MNRDTDGSVNMDSISPSYWRSIGHNDQYIRLMRTFLQRWSHQTKQLARNNRSQQYIQIVVQTGQNILHDDALLPNWDAFSKALLNCQHGIHTFQLSCVEVSEEVLHMLTPALKNKQLKCLSLRNNNFGRSGIIFMADVLESNRSMDGLWSTENIIDDAAAANRLSEAVRNHAHLQRLVLERSGLGENNAILSLILHSAKNLEHLNLGYNRIGLQGSLVITNLLSTNPGLVDLRLYGNELNDEAAYHISHALRNNNNLKYLDLEENEQLGPVGERILIQAVCDESSLNSTADSNHTCNLIMDGGSFMKNMDDVKKNRQEKIFHLLHDKGNGRLYLPHLDGIPVNLMPHVLELLQRDPKGKRVHTNTFDVLRNWKLPLLYT